MNKKILVTGGSGFIGTNLIDDLMCRPGNILNLDIKPPNIDMHSKYWQECDILDAELLWRHAEAFQPTHVIHLAAKTDTKGKTLEEYRINTEGSSNVLRVLCKLPTVERAIITSTQFVNQYKGFPAHDEDFAPHTVYGESKVITEQITRKANPPCIWTIIRPTNIWGAWHPRYPHEFWRVLGKGYYVHPKGRPVIRSYGYVNNVIWQMNRILEAPPEKVDRKVYYVGDMPINLLDWVNGFSQAQRGKDVTNIPNAIIKCIAYLGDALTYFNINFPLTSSRFRSMNSSNDANMQPTFETFGTPPYSLEEGINQTVAWLKAHYPNLVISKAPSRGKIWQPK